MKKRILGLISLISVLALSLPACTTSTSDSIPSETAVGKIPSSNSSAPPAQSPDLLKKHAENLGQGDAPFQILDEVQAVGSTTLRIGELPEGFDSVGFMISCDATSAWNIIMQSGTKYSANGCDSNSEIYTSISVPAQQINADEVQLELAEQVQVWATVYATNEE